MTGNRLLRRNFFLLLYTVIGITGILFLLIAQAARIWPYS